MEAGAVQCGFCTPGPDRRQPRPAGAQRVPDRRRDPRGAGRQPVPLHGLREDPRRGAAGAPGRLRMTDASSRAARSPRSTPPAPSTATATSSSRTTASSRSATGPAPAPDGDAARIDGRGCLATPGPRQLPPPPLPVGHARPRAAGDAVRVARRALSGVGARRRRGRVRRPRAPGWPRSRARAARPRPTTTTSSRPAPATCSRSRSRRRAALGVRFHPCRGSMDLGQSAGGLPPDEVVEDRDAILAASEAAIDRFHDPAPGAMVRIALAPCSPFSVTPRADGRDRRSSRAAAACACTPTWPRRSTRRSSARSASACARSSTSRTSAGWATTSGSRTAST